MLLGHFMHLQSDKSLFKYHRLCNTDTPIIEPYRVQNVSDTRVICVFKNFLRIRVLCPYQSDHVHATLIIEIRWLQSKKIAESSNNSGRMIKLPFELLSSSKDSL